MKRKYHFCFDALDDNGEIIDESSVFIVASVENETPEFIIEDKQITIKNSIKPAIELGPTSENYQKYFNVSITKYGTSIEVLTEHKTSMWYLEADDD